MSERREKLKRTPTKRPSLEEMASGSKRERRMDEEVLCLAIQGNLNDDNLLRETTDLYSYQSFNPKNMRRILYDRAPSDEAFTNDMTVLITILCERGTNLPKMMQNIKEEGVARLKELRHRYQIVDSGSKLTKMTVTMSRIGACFPEEVSKCLERGIDTRFPSINLPDGFPRSMLHPGAASLIPTDKSVGALALLNAHLDFLVQFDLLINKNPTSVTQIRTYQMAAHNSVLIPYQKRKIIADQLDWINLDENTGAYTINESFNQYYPNKWSMVAHYEIYKEP